MIASFSLSLYANSNLSLYSISYRGVVEYPENDQDLAMYFNTLLGTDIEMRRMLIEEAFNRDGDNT